MECVEDDPISLIIDNREQHILKEMKTPEFVNLNPLVKFTTANLDIGDFKISIQNTHILIERKTFPLHRDRGFRISSINEDFQ